MNICLKKLFIAIGYSETTWKAARTRAIGTNTIEVLEESKAIKLIEQIASSKITKANNEKVANAQKILGMKKWKEFGVDVCNTTDNATKVSNSELENLMDENAKLKQEISMLKMIMKMAGVDYDS